MKTFSQLSEDLAQKRQELQQKRLEQMQAQKQKAADYREAQQERIQDFIFEVRFLWSESLKPIESQFLG